MFAPMLIEAGKMLYSVNKSMQMDEKALGKYARAFEMQEKAELIIKAKAEFTDKRLGNVAKKKRAIINNTIPQFVEVYEAIQKVEISVSDNALKLPGIHDSQNQLAIGNLSVISKKEFTDKELVCGLLTKGIGKMIEKDSERYLSAASNQLRAAKVVHSQAESIAAVYDAIVERADRISKLLMAMNAVFVKSIQETDKTIKKNGFDVRNYSEYDKGVLMTCVNIAVALSDIIKVPVIDENGIICQETEAVIVKGEKYLQQMRELTNL